jgi:predicted GIY-YIG superfamily endonuclease
LPIHGCHRTFEQLAHEELPSHMDQLRDHMRSPIAMAEFAAKSVGPATLRKRFDLERDPSGCYVLIDQGKAVYVGISKHVIQRLMGHVRGGDHMTATLAYRIAVARYPHGKTAALAMQDETTSASASMRPVSICSGSMSPS